MQELYVASVALKRNNTYFMQYRDGNPSIGAVGLVGFFGGKVEPGEVPEVAARRELSEETDLVFASADRLEEIDTVEVISDYKQEPATVHMTIFGFDLPLGAQINAKEGKITAMTKDEALANLDKLTPATRAYFEKNFQGEV